MASQLSGCGFLSREYIEPTPFPHKAFFAKFHEKPLLTASLTGTFSSKLMPRQSKGGSFCAQAIHRRLSS